MKQILLCLVFLIFTFLSGCGKQAPAKKDTLVYVNKEPITASELKREIALRAKQDPGFRVTPETEQDQLNAIINRKLIIQEAMEKGLAREERFVNTIKAFWEQTLIRDFIDFKKKEFQEYLFVTDDDVKKYYNNLSKKVTFGILRSRDKKYIDGIYTGYQKNKTIDTSAWEQFGPLGCEDLTSTVLQEAFEMDQGAVGRFEDAAGNYYLVTVAGIERTEPTPIEELKPEIEKRVLIMKEKRLFEDWLREKRGKSKIEQAGNK